MMWRRREVAETRELLDQSREAVNILTRLVAKLDVYTTRIEAELAHREHNDDAAAPP